METNTLMNKETLPWCTALHSHLICPFVLAMLAHLRKTFSIFLLLHVTHFTCMVTNQPVNFRWKAHSESPWHVFHHSVRSQRDRYNHIFALCPTTWTHVMLVTWLFWTYLETLFSSFKQVSWKELAGHKRRHSDSPRKNGSMLFDHKHVANITFEMDR